MLIGYQILYADGRVTDGQVAVPEPEDDPEAKKLWPILKKLVKAVINEDNEREDNEPEHVNVWHDGKYLDMFVDERGHPKGLPRNEAATTIYRANWMAHEANPGNPEDLPHIAGDAILFLEKVWR